MKKYKVIAGATWSERMGRNYPAGEILTADMFNEGEAERRVKEGWIEEVIESEIEPIQEEVVEVIEQPKKEAKKGK